VKLVRLSHRQFKRWAILFLAGAALCGGIYALIGNPLDPFDNRRFSVSAWKEAEGQQRARMSEDLIAHHLPPGMTEQQVVALLGQPEGVDLGPTEKRIAKRYYVYYIGNWSLQEMDDAYLYVHLDANDRVVKAEIYGY
jgi:outer membrane protein assembly factor BamE (lipoprotein component of BamABCDE complex)